MLNYLRKDRAVQLHAIECNRCVLCEQSDGACERLACGHSACADCVAAGECKACAPLMDLTSSRPRMDDPTTEGTNVSELPTYSQDTFKSAVYQKQRISERLRVEKELFPECIQAPAKYYNKRKSLNVSKRDKENRWSVFPGEETLLSREISMNKSKNFVQEWLNKQPNSSFGPQTRSPFSDLKVNTKHRQPAHSTLIKGKDKENAPKLQTRLSNRKRSRLKLTPSTNSLSSLENYLKPPEKGKNNFTWNAERMKKEFDDTSKPTGNKQPCDESGIVIDDDCYTIEDTQDQTLDKDRLALLEVQRANLKELAESVIVIENTDEDHSVIEEAPKCIEHDEMTCHVPFYRKSLLFESCAHCITPSKDTLTERKLASPDNTQKSSDISITVENKSFVTTITVVNCNPVASKKQSTEVQTDVVEPFLGFVQPTQRESMSLIAKLKEYIETESISPSREGQVPETESQRTSCTDIIMEKYDGDRNVNEDNMALGHSSKHDFAVLTALDGAGFQNKRKRRARGATPDSNNSSDKENCDPNRKKKGDTKKKKKYK